MWWVWSVWPDLHNPRLATWCSCWRHHPDLQTKPYPLLATWCSCWWHHPDLQTKPYPWLATWCPDITRISKPNLTLCWPRGVPADDITRISKPNLTLGWPRGVPADDITRISKPNLTLGWPRGVLADDITRISKPNLTLGWPRGVPADGSVLQAPGVAGDKQVNHLAHHVAVITLSMAACTGWVTAKTCYLMTQKQVLKTVEVYRFKQKNYQIKITQFSPQIAIQIL